MSYSVGQMVRVLGTPWAGKVKLVDTAHSVVMLDVWREHGPDERYEDAPYHFDEIEAAPDLGGPPHKHEWVKVVGGLAQCHCGSTIGSPLLAEEPVGVDGLGFDGCKGREP